jgi:cardiolipin synthase
MEQAYLRDLDNATELFLKSAAPSPPPARAERRPPGAERRAPVPRSVRRGRGSAGRAAAGVVRVGNAMGAALGRGRVLQPTDARLVGAAGGVALALASLFLVFPRVLAYPLAAFLAWIALALFYKSYRLHRDQS